MKLTLREEQLQWLRNYDLLLIEMEAAYRFKNKEAIYDLEKRILNTQVQIATVTRELEKKGDTDSYRRVGAAMGRDVKVSDNASVNLKGINRFWGK